MIGALFDIHCRLNGWKFKSGERAEEVVFIDEVPFL